MGGGERHKEDGGIVRSEKGIKGGLPFPHEGRMNGELGSGLPTGVRHTHTPLLCLQRRLEQFHSVPQRSRGALEPYV